jgi:CRP-like cAMP-binding protein
MLAALPASNLQRWLPQLEKVLLPLGKVLYESGATMRHVYFPTTCIVSLLYQTQMGSASELAVVGKEGLVGISLFMGGGSTTSCGIVQREGEAYRLPAQVIQDEIRQAGPVLHLLLRFTQSLITQIGQNAACNRHHTVEAQFCRHLLLSLDRISGQELRLTHESAANILGVRREGVTEAALKLQRSGLIRYARGRVEVLDRRGLESRTCECYAVVTGEYQRLLPACTAV